ncbi:MAG: universal stress protein [Pseudomonadota bacterium]
MNSQKNEIQRILVALDGSERAFKTIRYLCTFKPFLKKELVLHNVITKVPECFYDLKNDPFSSKTTAQVFAWELEHKSQIETFMDKSQQMLISAGFDPEAIRVVIAQRKRGIARDIMDESHNGYAALLIRRRGNAQAFLPIVMGSVSTKLVEKLDTLPIMLAGIHEVNHSLLIAIDGSQGAKRAVHFVIKMIEKIPCRIILCCVLRDFNVANNQCSDNCVSVGYEEIETAVTEARDILECGGIPKNNIGIKIIHNAKSRSAAIVETARLENCDTFVFGRKGRSDTREFDIGRVPWKVIHGEREKSVWLVP